MKAKPLNLLLGIVVVAFLAKQGWAEWQAHQAGEPSPLAERFEVPQRPASPSKATSPRAVTHASNFACDGRTQCHQMTSCEEAKFFLAHCPNTQMDADANGVPCEKTVCF